MFVVQDHEILPDFCYEALRAVEYQNWLSLGSAQVRRVSDFDFSTFSEVDIPVGSLEFVRSFFSQKLGITSDPRPLNVPTCLHKYCYVKRSIWNDVTRENIDTMIDELPSKIFVKPATRYKDFVGDIVVKESLAEYLRRHSCIDISEVVEFKDEWRVFVHNYNFLDLKCYSGIFSSYPNDSFIMDIVSTLKQNTPSLRSYALDLGLIGVDYAVIEVHPFVSCGLYGFRDPRYLLAMFVNGAGYWRGAAG